MRDILSRIRIARAIFSNGTSTRICDVGVFATRYDKLATWLSSNSHQSAFGCMLMSPRPSLSSGRLGSRFSAGDFRGAAGAIDASHRPAVGRRVARDIEIGRFAGFQR
jgi:hypothetical protein